MQPSQPLQVEFIAARKVKSAYLQQPAMREGRWLFTRIPARSSATARAPGLTAALKTREGGLMTISYGTAEDGLQEHTGTQRRIAAYDPRAVNVSGLLDQTDLHYIIRNALRLD
jgi:alkaline phosphatase